MSTKKKQGKKKSSKKEGKGEGKHMNLNSRKLQLGAAVHKNLEQVTASIPLNQITHGHGPERSKLTESEVERVKKLCGVFGGLSICSSWSSLEKAIRYSQMDLTPHKELLIWEMYAEMVAKEEHRQDGGDTASREHIVEWILMLEHCQSYEDILDLVNKETKKGVSHVAQIYMQTKEEWHERLVEAEELSQSRLGLAMTRTCAMCGHLSLLNKRCGSCATQGAKKLLESKYYCGTSCQKKHWKTHKHVCQGHTGPGKAKPS